MENKNYNAIQTAKDYSQRIISNLKSDFESLIQSKQFCIVTTGSFARCEASKASDLDYFIITEDEIINTEYFEANGALELTSSFKKIMEDSVNKYIKKDSGDTGTFGFEAIVRISDLTTNIGGSNDSNVQFTRRMLFLLEGKCLYNDELFNKFRKKLVEKYIKATVSDYQPSRFFLNDIIRFYRTMTTDFEYKVSEQGKEWGVRNIKLTFSRKLLYFGGILTVAETAKKTRKMKISETLEFLDMSPLERIKYIAKDNADKVFELYNYFLENISQHSVREELEKAKKENTKEQNPRIFVAMKEKSQEFSCSLASLLEATYDKSHPIHHALIL